MDSDTSAMRLRLTRNPMVIECARAASSFVNAHTEVAVFDDDRVFIVASDDADLIMRPRAMTNAEQRLWAQPEKQLTAIDGWLALPIRDVSANLIASLSISVTVAKANFELTLAGLQSLVRLLEIELGRNEVDAPDFLHSLVHGQRDAVAVLSQEMVITWMSNGITSLVGRTPQELMGHPATDFIHPDDVEIVFDAVIRMSQGLYVNRVNVRLKTPTGDYVTTEVTATDLSNNPAVDGLVLSLRNGERELENARAGRESERRSNAIVSSLRDGVIATDDFGAIVTVNNAARSMFDIDQHTSPAGLSPSDFLLQSEDGEPHDPFGAGEDSSIVCRIDAPNSKTLFVTTSQQSIIDEDGGFMGEVIVFSDVTAEHRAAEELVDLAMHDQLTGLANRHQLDLLLSELALASPGILVAACFMDLDHFKNINDVHGHNVGDQVVRVAAQRLSAQLGPNDLLVRQGGDEFLALLVGPEDSEAAVLIAENCRTALAAPYLIGEQRHDITCSIGVAIEQAAYVGSSRLLENADMALYAAKDAGRNQVQFFDETLAIAARTAEAKRKRLKRAIESDQLTMHFQPLVDTYTEKTLGFEALARISTPVGVLTPDSFLEDLTNSSLMWELDRTAFKLSCEAAAQMLAISPDMPPRMACNFSAVSFNHPEFLTMLMEISESEGVPPWMISIELTESTAFDIDVRGTASLHELSELGFSLVLDDFGTGYSSLAHIRDLPISALKVDRSFVTSLDTNASERAIAEAIVGLANDLDFRVVAEGVETEEQLEQARQIGFTSIQGWYFSKALPLDEALDHWHTTIHPDQVKRAS